MEATAAHAEAIVCAASKGLGRSCAMALAKNGVDLVINARTASELEATAADIRAATGRTVTAVACDITSPEGRAQVLAACPNPDILVNNAGGPPPASRDPFFDQPYEPSPLSGESKPAWEQKGAAAAAAPVRGLSPNIRSRRKVGSASAARSGAGSITTGAAPSPRGVFRPVRSCRRRSSAAPAGARSRR